MLAPKGFAAVFTRVKNERFLLPIWLRYYSRFFHPNDLYVLDHESNDGSTLGGGCQKIRIFNRFAWDDPWLTERVEELQRKLLRRYDLVLYVDVDEFIVPDPERYRDLKHYLQCFDRDFIQTTSYTVCHDYNTEPSLDLSKPILSQRTRWAYMGKGWGKTGLSRIPIDWGIGQHSCLQNPTPEIDKHLYLVHLPLMDVDLTRQRRIDRCEGYDIGRLSGRHELQTEMEEVKAHARSLLEKSEPIPEKFRQVQI